MMPGLMIGWEYLTGCCVATDPTSRQRAEWPPHPGRVFMALAAAWFETGEDEAEGRALRWLEQLGNPELGLPAEVWPRKVVDYYVPVNDDAGPSRALLQSAPGLTRDRKERTFPTVWVGDTPCFLRWSHADPADVESHRPALQQLCDKVTRIGHSSSLVRMWIADETNFSTSTQTWVPDDGLAELQTRRVSEGTLELLDRLFNRRGREESQRLSRQIEDLEAERRAARGRGATQRRTELDRQIADARARQETVDARDPIRPKLGMWTGYRRQPTESLLPEHTAFDSELLILTQTKGPRLSITSSLMVTHALRNAIISHLGQDHTPDWVSGRHANNEPLRNDQQHLAFIPLPFVGSPHADGHLLGAALAFPRSVPRSERGRTLGTFLLDPASGQPRSIELPLGSLGDWVLTKRDWSEPRQTLKPETWTAHPNGATTWASVTPVVLDRFPKSDLCQDYEAWREEIAGIVTTACERIGLPAPDEVSTGTTSWHVGSPRAIAKSRPLRGHPETPNTTATLGDGFPAYRVKTGNASRPQVHVRLRFEKPVVGPILLGAGRFFGYGLCKPLRDDFQR